MTAILHGIFFLIPIYIFQFLFGLFFSFIIGILFPLFYLDFYFPFLLRSFISFQFNFFLNNFLFFSSSFFNFFFIWSQSHFRFLQIFFFQFFIFIFRIKVWRLEDNQMGRPIWRKELVFLPDIISKITWQQRLVYLTTLKLNFPRSPLYICLIWIPMR